MEARCKARERCIMGCKRVEKHTDTAPHTEPKKGPHTLGSVLASSALAALPNRGSFSFTTYSQSTLSW